MSRKSAGGSAAEGRAASTPSRRRSGRILRWAGFVIGGVLILALLAWGVLVVLSERIVARTYEAPLTSFAASSDLASIAEGKRLATVRGCFGGCHGDELEGGLFFDEPVTARVVAPNLTAAVRRYTDPELERVVRRGVRRDGRSVFAMPSNMFHHLSDEDLGAIVAFLRSWPASEGPETEIRLGPLGRLGIVLGEFPPKAEEIAGLEARLPAASTEDPRERGRYLALTGCTECHGNDLRGREEGAPDLRIVAAYPAEDFRRLLRTGVALGERELGLMREVGLGRFRHFRDDEIEALRAYLGTLASDTVGGVARQP